MKRKLRVISLFSGAGGMDYGLLEAGLNIAWANDNDTDCVDTYKDNVDKRIVHGDIKDISSSKIPNGDIVVGGFPCQGFSVANKFRSSLDKRNELYLEMLRVIRDKKPRWFVVENVRGILSIGDGVIFQEILQDFRDVGYRVNYKVVNMADHGVPQTRQRVIILGTRSDLPKRMTAYHPEQTHSKEGDVGKNWVTVGEAIRKFSKQGISDDLRSKYKIVNRNFTGHRKTDPNKPSPTILARGDGKGGVNATPHPYDNRRLSVMESACIQTFPIDFVFRGSMTSQYRQIGNAVPVEYGYELGIMFNKLPTLTQ